MRIGATSELDALDFAKGGGCVAVVVQDARTRELLMVAAADREALTRTLETGELHLRSRTRGLWRKGATSGNVQRVSALITDCDSDAVLALVEPAGPACHTGAVSCFEAPPPALRALDAVITQRINEGADVSYTRRLASDRNLRLKKLGEESAELAVACADGDRERVVAEAADLLYHLLVAARCADVSLADIEHELDRRRPREPARSRQAR